MNDLEMEEPTLQIRFASASAVALSNGNAKSRSPKSPNLGNRIKQPNPLDERVDCLLLDLSGTEQEHAATALRSITAALAPQLYLQGEKSWIVATGPLSPHEAALLMAKVLAPLGYEELRIATIRGESLSDRLEELSQAGVQLIDESGKPLLDYVTPPLSILTEAPAATIAEALTEGAQIVLTQNTAVGSMALGVYGSRMVGASLPLESAAAIASAAELVVPLHSDPNRRSSSPLHYPLATTNPRGECEILGAILPQTAEPLEGVVSQLRTKKSLPELSYETCWNCDSQGILQLHAIEAKASTTSCNLKVEVAQHYQLEFRARFSDTAEFETWLKSISALLAEEPKINYYPLESAEEKPAAETSSQLPEKQYLISIESKDRNELESAAVRIELTSLPPHGGPKIKNALSDTIRRSTHTFELSTPKETLGKVVEFQNQIETVKEWLD